MKESLFVRMDDDERLSALQANCEETIEGFIYTRELTPNEKEERHLIISQKLAEIDELSEEAKKLNESKKHAKKEIAFYNQEIISNSRKVNENIYKVTDLEEMKIQFINEQGYIIDEKPIKGARMVPMFKQEAVNE